MAEEVRPRLSVVSSGVPLQAEKPSPLEERFAGKQVRQHVKEFGALFGAIFLGIAALYALDDDLFSVTIFTAVASLIAYLGYREPLILHPFWKGWMRFAELLSSVVTPVLLTVLWILLVIPIALIMRVVGVRRMELATSAGKTSYWIDRSKDDQSFQLLRRQF